MEESRRTAVVFEFMKMLAREGGEMMLKHRDLNIEKKGANNFVTDIDKAVQAMLISRLSNAVPDAFFTAEEKDNTDNPVGEGFIIDPIDGTHNFMNDLPICAVSIAYVCDGEVMCSVVYNPFREEMFAAIKGGGAFLNGEPIHCKNRPLENSLILTEDSWKGDRRVIRKYALGSRILGSAELAICYVACGRAGGWISQKLHIWDYAAGKLILEEAGGILIEKDGREARLIEPSQVGATSPENRSALIQIWNEAEPDQTV